MRIHKFLSAAIVMIMLGVLLAACGGAAPAAKTTAAPRKDCSTIGATCLTVRASTRPIRP